MRSFCFDKIMRAYLLATLWCYAFFELNYIEMNLMFIHMEYLYRSINNK